MHFSSLFQVYFILNSLPFEEVVENQKCEVEQKVKGVERFFNEDSNFLGLKRVIQKF